MVNRFLFNDFMNQLVINSITNGCTERKLVFCYCQNQYLVNIENTNFINSLMNFWPIFHSNLHK
jgi:hypothetical protein